MRRRQWNEWKKAGMERKKAKEKKVHGVCVEGVRKNKKKKKKREKMKGL